jgi:hypothetical protein
MAEISCGVGISRPEKAATQVAGDVEILLPLAGLVDVDAEEVRLLKEIAKVEKDVELFEKKLVQRGVCGQGTAAGAGERTAASSPRRRRSSASCSRAWRRSGRSSKGRNLSLRRHSREVPGFFPYKNR